MAHLLRRQRATEFRFPPAALVPAADPQTRRRSALEDLRLLAVRAAAIVVIALLGAKPVARGSRLDVARREGASVALAIVLDDSLSMRAALDDGTPRFVRAARGAHEIVSGLVSGDAVGIVLAGSPVRVALSATTNIPAATTALQAVQPSDRATDLDGAIREARSLLEGLPHRDKRVVLLSDLADGSPPDAHPLLGDVDMALWFPLPELESHGADCAVLDATRAGSRVSVHVSCTSFETRHPSSSTAQVIAASPWPSRGRKLQLSADDQVLASVALGDDVRNEKIVLDVPRNAPDTMRARLTGRDAIAEDDTAPVIGTAPPLRIAIVVDAATTRIETGGPTPIEQAFVALDTEATIRPLPSVPDEADALNEYSALIIDDAPGFTPLSRRALARWVEHGGVALLTLGPRAASAPWARASNLCCQALCVGARARCKASTWTPLRCSSDNPRTDLSTWHHGVVPLLHSAPRAQARCSRDGWTAHPWSKREWSGVASFFSWACL